VRMARARPGQWTVSCPGPVWVERLRLVFRYFGSWSSPRAYRVEARWEGRFLPLVSAAAQGEAEVEHVLPAPFRTDALRVVIEDEGLVGLAEVEVVRLSPVAPGTTAYDDIAAPDGTHTYRVTAIDVYGAEGPAGSVTVGVGNTAPPSPPTGLAAEVERSDVQLTWNPNPEPDVVGYVVLRDGERIGTSAAPAYLDPGRPN